MTDPLDRLKSAMDTASPPVDADRKARSIADAEEIFARDQEMAAEARLKTDRTPLPGRLRQGVAKMFAPLTSRGGLVATTAIVAVGLVMVLPQSREIFAPPKGITVELDEVGLGARQSVEGDDAEFRLQERDARIAPQEPQRAEAPVLAEESFSADLQPKTERELGFADGSLQQNAPASQGIASTTETPQAIAKQSARIRQAQESVAADLSVIAPAPAPADPFVQPDNDTEAFANDETNPVKVTSEEPVSTFSIDVDTASYSIVRSSLNRGSLPPPQAVRVEELVNYFPYNYAAPEGPHPFQPTVSVIETPWNPDTQLVHIGIQGEMPATEDRPPLNLVFLIDSSGSMQDADKLPLLKTAFRMMLAELRPEDEVSIVTYAGSAGQVLAPTKAGERQTILNALERLEAGGSTAGQAGLQQAYATAEQMAADGEVTRVILATDGDFNVGLSDPEALKDFIAEKRESGTYLSVLGFGRGNLDDATMQALAQNGNGQAAYIDTASEARKVLVDQLTGALFPIANDVKIQMEFNPAQIAEYRLIGYETRALNREDFNNDRVDAGEIGAGHSVTAIYEVTPVGSPARLTDPLRYGATPAASDSDELGFLRLRYKRPGETVSTLIETPVGSGLSEAGNDVRFAAAIAGFGQLLRGDDAQIDWSFAEAAALAAAARGEDPFGYRQEAVQLIRIADSLSR